MRRFIRRVGPDNIDRQFAVRRADVGGRGNKPDSGNAHNEVFEQRVRRLLQQRTPISLKDLPISGQDVIEILVKNGAHPAGYRGGRDVGVILERLLETVIENPADGSRELLLNRCADMACEIRQGDA